MTSSELEKRLADLEMDVAELRVAEEFRSKQESIAAIKEALASIDRGEGIPAEEAFAMLRREFDANNAAAAAMPVIIGTRS